LQAQAKRRQLLQAEGVGAHGLLSDAQLLARMDLFTNAAAVSIQLASKVADTTKGVCNRQSANAAWICQLHPAGHGGLHWCIMTPGPVT